MWNAIYFIGETTTVNEYGDMVKVPTRREVMAEEKSVGMNEFFQGMAVGFKPEIKFVIQNYLDYQGEDWVAYTPFNETKELRLKILRTYRDGDTLEITCYKGVETQ